MRAPVGVVPPLAGQIQPDLGLNAVQIGLLTSIPVACFGLLTPVASYLLRVLGINHAAVYCLLAVIAGSLIRSAAGMVGLYVGTLLIGAGITVGNLAVPMLIGRQFQSRAPLLTSAYTATVNIAVTLATALAVPVAHASNWRVSAGLFGVVLGGVALAAWLWVYPPGVRGARASVYRHTKATGPASRVRSRNTPDTPHIPLRRWRVAWLLAVAFSGHTLSYYAVTAWLPVALAELRHMDPTRAGVASSIFQGAGIVGPFVVPLLLQGLRWPLPRTLVAICACWAVLPIAMIVAPAGWLVWSAVSGSAQGAFFTALFVVIIQRSRSLDENRRLSSMVQSVGYVVAATGPVLLGWVREQMPGWDAAFGVVLVAVVVMTVCTMAAVRDSARPPVPGGSPTVSA